MLRELNTNEMELVAGGTGEDEVVVTGQRRPRSSGITHPVYTPTLSPDFFDGFGGDTLLESSGSGGNVIGNFTVDLGEANSTMELGDTTVSVETRTTIEIEIIIPEENEGHVIGCLKTPIGCLDIIKFPSDK